MALPEPIYIVGTPAQLATQLGQLPGQKRYRLIEVEATEMLETPPLADPNSAASIALLQSWIAQAPTDPTAVLEAEEDLLEFKREMNKPRKEGGSRLHYPEAE